MVFDSEREKLMSEYRGQFNMGEMFKEAATHKEHGDGEYVPTKNADGDVKTLEACKDQFIPGTELTWEELSESTGRDIEDLQKEFGEKINDGHEPEDIVEGMIEESQEENEKEDEGRYREGPWDKY
jgi:hypothetical protein